MNFKFLLLFLLVSSYTIAQATLNLNLDANVSGWVVCVKPTCDPGGIGVPSLAKVTQTGANWPAGAIKISETGPAWTNLLVYHNVGVTLLNNFSLDLYAMPNSNSNQTNYHSLEFDIFAYNSPYRYMFGSQCVLTKMWQVWDELNQKWLDTSVKCDLKFGSWHHIQLFVHRLDNDFNCLNFPCMYYDTLGIDNVYTKINMVTPASFIPPGWANQSGLNLQLDLDNVSGAKNIYEYFKQINLIYE